MLIQCQKSFFFMVDPRLCNYLIPFLQTVGRKVVVINISHDLHSQEDFDLQSFSVDYYISISGLCDFFGIKKKNQRMLILVIAVKMYPITSQVCSLFLDLCLFSYLLKWFLSIQNLFDHIIRDIPFDLLLVLSFQRLFLKFIECI